MVVPPKTPDTEIARIEQARYVQAVENMDQKLGKMRALVETYLDPKNTLLVYSSDNGQSWPFGKWSLYETGIRTPLIAVWPGKIAPKSSTRAMVSWIDLLPTFIDIAGGEIGWDVDGRSFKNVLVGESDQHRERIFAIHKGDMGWNVYPIRSVRSEKWKYILNVYPEFKYTTLLDLAEEGTSYYNRQWPSWVQAAKTDPAAAAFFNAYHARPKEELYRVEDDPYETTNLAGSPEVEGILKEMRSLVRRRIIESGDDLGLSGLPRRLPNN